MVLDAAACKCEWALSYQLAPSIIWTCFDLNQTRQKDNERTIEGLIFNALVKLGAVSEDNADDPVGILHLEVNGSL